MNILVKINSIDRTDTIEWKSFVIEDNIDDQPNTCSFLIKGEAGDTFKPIAGDIVEVWDGVDMIYSGKIARIKNNIYVDTIYFNVTCRDKTSELDRRQITESFSNTTVEAIIKYMVDNYYQGMGITYANVSCVIPVTKLVFNKMAGSKCISELATLTNYNWFIDYVGDVHFFSKSSVSAPYSIGEGSDIVVGDSLEFNSDVTQLRNVVMIEGGEMTSSSNKTQNILADGVNKTFGTNYKFATIPVVGTTVIFNGRKKITITGQAGVGTSYPVLLKIGESVGSVGANVHVEGKCVAFPSSKNISGDIRFKGADGSTDLPFWVESVTGVTPNRIANCWVKVADDLSANKDIYIYYKGDITNASNGNNTFLLFDDFDDAVLDVNKWVVSAGSVGDSSVEAGSELTLINDAVSPQRTIQSKNAFTGDVEVVSRMKTAVSGGNNGLLFMDADKADGQGIAVFLQGVIFNLYSRAVGTWTSAGASLGSNPLNTYAIDKLKLVGSTAQFFKDNIQVGSNWTKALGVNRYLMLDGRIWNEATTDNCNLVHDYLFVKKAVAVEPIFASVLAEEIVTSTIYTVGVDNIDKDVDFQVLWNFNEKYIRFVTPPSSNNQIQITSKPLIPIMVQVENLASISEFGRYEFSKVDKTIASENEAMSYAQSQLDSYAASVREGGFSTYQSGFESGQLLSINLPSLGIVESFVIQKVGLKMFSQTKGFWNVELATTKTIGIIAFLQNQLMAGKKTVELNKDQVIKKYYCDWVQLNVTEEISMKAKLNDWQQANVTELIEKDPFGAGVYPNFCLGPFVPTSNNDPDREFKLDLSLLS